MRSLKFYVLVRVYHNELSVFHSGCVIAEDKQAALKKAELWIEFTKKKGQCDGYEVGIFTENKFVPPLNIPIENIEEFNKKEMTEENAASPRIIDPEDMILREDSPAYFNLLNLDRDLQNLEDQMRNFFRENRAWREIDFSVKK